MGNLNLKSQNFSGVLSALVIDANKDWGGFNITNMGDLTVGNLITAGNVDGRDVSVDGSKLDGIEVGATADQTKADIDALGLSHDSLADVSTSDHHAKYTDAEAVATVVAQNPLSLTNGLSLLDDKKIILGTGNDGEIFVSSDHLNIKNVTSNMDLILGINDGGVAKTITWDADVDKLKHSAGTFNFDDDNITTTGNITGNNYILPVTTATVGQIQQPSGTRMFHTYVPSDQAPSYANVFIGEGSGNFTMTNVGDPWDGCGNVSIGTESLSSLTTGYYNFALGTRSLLNNTEGNSNIAIGHQAGRDLDTGDRNVLIGRDTGVNLENSYQNVFIGTYAANTAAMQDVRNNVGIGDGALQVAQGVDNCIAIGGKAGMDENQSGRLIIDNQDRGDAATTRTNAIIYGIMAVAPANQTLTFNADVGINILVPSAMFSVGGDSRFGDDTTNYSGFSATGDQSFVGSAGFYPRRVTQSAEPANGTGATQIDVGELMVWRDPDDNKTYLIYNDTDEGVRKVEMT